MFKTMNKQKKEKEKKELKKGTKKCLPSNAEEIYLFYVSNFVPLEDDKGVRKKHIFMSYTEHHSSAVCEK